MYAVVQSGGKQYRVSPGDLIRVETVPGETGASGMFERVLAVSTDDGRLLAGKDAAGAQVEASVVRHGRTQKVLVFHYKKKKQYKKTQGHRQNFTELKVGKISLP